MHALGKRIHSVQRLHVAVWCDGTLDALAHLRVRVGVLCFPFFLIVLPHPYTLRVLLFLWLAISRRRIVSSPAKPLRIRPACVRMLRVLSQNGLGSEFATCCKDLCMSECDMRRGGKQKSGSGERKKARNWRGDGREERGRGRQRRTRRPSHGPGPHAFRRVMWS